MRKELNNARVFWGASLVSLIYALAIILWGAFVRLSGSGDGCGKHWPFCQGYIVPRGEFLLSLQTWVEYLHRLKSGLFGILVLVLLIAAFRLFEKGHLARRAALAVFIFTMIEALIGAALVIFGWVDQDTSPARVFVGGLHLVNTFALLATQVALCLFAYPPYASKDLRFEWRHQSLSTLAFCSFITLCVFGHWASLAAQLYPVSSLVEGLAADFDPESPWIVRLRVFHPALAVISILILLFWYARLHREALSVSFKAALIFLLGAFVFGANLWLWMSPLWMKISHLLIADLIWMGMVLAFLQDGLREATGGNLLALRFQSKSLEKNLSPSL